jgi:hypothetical protein
VSIYRGIYIKSVVLFCEINIINTISCLQSVDYGGYKMPSRAGSPNKPKRLLISRLEKAYGKQFHPIMRLAENAVRLEEIAKQSNDVTALRASVDAWDRIAQYTEPKLKAVEVKADNELVVSVQRKVFSGTDAD